MLVTTERRDEGAETVGEADLLEPFQALSGNGILFGVLS